MLSATAKTSFMLCEMRTTARPLSASWRTSSSTWAVCATPSAAVGSSRTTSLLFQSTALAIATVCRWPPERLATSWRIDLTVRTDRPASVSAARCSMFGSSSTIPLVFSRPRNMFCTMSRLSQSARSWYTISMPSADASRGLWTVTGLTVEEVIAGVHRVDAADALDERGLAGAVVADERGDLAGVSRRGRRRAAPCTAPKLLLTSAHFQTGASRSRMVAHGMGAPHRWAGSRRAVAERATGSRCR